MNNGKIELPQGLIDELIKLEQRKRDLLSGFMFSLNVQGTWRLSEDCTHLIQTETPHE